MTEHCWLVTFIIPAYMAAPERIETLAVVAPSVGVVEQAVFYAKSATEHGGGGRVRILKIEHVADDCVLADGRPARAR